MTSAFSAKFHLPPQDRDAPTLFAASCDAVKTWLAGLPKANLGQSTRALFSAVTELNQVRMSPSLRLQILDLLRPSIHTASQSLSRHYLNQPIVLPEQAQRVARLAHVLHEQLATGYILAAVQTLALGNKPSGFTNPAHAIATAAHRSIVEHSQNLLRDYQLYRTPHPGCWATLHQLAKFAREQNVFNAVIADAQGGDCSLEAAYLRALLLGGSHPNQLRQEHLAKVFQHALGWTDAAMLTTQSHSLLVVAPDGDEGPCYREFADLETHWLGIDTSRLAAMLQQQYELVETQPLVDRQLPPELLNHLAHTWSSALHRSHVRMDVSEQIEIALGMTAAHHFIGGEIEFNLLVGIPNHSQLTLQDDNVFLRPKFSGTDKTNTRTGVNPHDVWSSPYEPRLGVMNVSLEILDAQMREQQQKAGVEKEREKFHSQQVERINVSPGGLCITWPPNSNVQLRSGEIVGIREKTQRQWSIGIVRWVQLTEVGPRLGIELLSPSAVPYGGRVINKAGDPGEYQRILVLPEIKQINQPTTLIAPRLPFRTGQKVSLMRNGKETRVQLTRKINSTAAFNQFEFRRLSSATNDTQEAAAKQKPHDSGFDNLWDSL